MMGAVTSPDATGDRVGRGTFGRPDRPPDAGPVAGIRPTEGRRAPVPDPSNHRLSVTLPAAVNEGLRARSTRAMATYQFLSDEWLNEARAIRAEFDGKGASIDQSIRINLVIGAVPFGEGTVDAHVDTSSGELILDTGHIDPIDLKVSLDYDVAKAILVEGNPQAGMQAFMAGKIKVEGDIAKLMALQSITPDPAAVEIASRILEITE
jgi:hypothetical protein